jgi:uncharacterized protein YprB with RNaseH-like and TPR domain
MLRRTFCHLPGVGPHTETRLWEAGIATWDDLPQAPVGVMPPAKLERLRAGIAASEAQLARGEVHSFVQGLASQHHWRLFPTLRSAVAYLDIETTGLGSPGDIITTIAVYDGQQVLHFVNDQNLNEFPKVIEQYQMLVTYNGKCFDVPFIERFFDIRLEQVHLDLRYILRQLGLGGGLKGCEKALGMDRHDVAGLDGFHAVVLWHEWAKQGRQKSLDTLLAYNVADTINLEALMVYAYNHLLCETPFAAVETVPNGVAPDNPFQADPATVARLLSSAW